MARSPDEKATAVKTQAVLLDPGTLEVVWVSQCAAAGPIEGNVPTAAAMGLEDPLRAVAATGVARRLHADVVSMSKKSVALVVCVYRLPDGPLTPLAEHASRVE
jgi:hypothetical protein